MLKQFTKATFITPLLFSIVIQDVHSAMAMTTQPAMEDADVAKIVEKAKIELAARKVKGCIAIANAEGVTIYFERQAGAYTNCNGSALVKAKAAAEFRMDTSDAMTMLDGKSQTHLLAVPDMAPLPGGSPIVVDGIVIGGVGVSSPDGDLDAPIAKAASAALDH
jgi:glc operon protein GlcG